MSLSNKTHAKVPQSPEIWWSNGIFFVAVHIAALLGVYWYPPTVVPRATLLLAFLSWQLADFGITIGYHRLYSHRAFRAKLGVRIVLALLGAGGFQGSIKWWCLRHRLHHRYTDDPEHDPYAATRGLFFSHMGWIFFKPKYQKLDAIDREDLDRDPVVRFQHQYYVPLALFMGFVFPTLLGSWWHDPVGAFIWAGLASRLAVWHCTFLVNSLAHWDGLQPYSDEDTSRGNIVLALLTGGEGHHNFHVSIRGSCDRLTRLTVLAPTLLQHAFPHDYRSGPSLFDWDPSKWIILALQWMGMVSALRRARNEDMREAVEFMREKDANGQFSLVSKSSWQGVIWNLEELEAFVKSERGRCVVVIEGWVVDVTGYMGEHPGGAKLLRKYSIRPGEDDRREDASWAFAGGLNNHSRAARRRMMELTIAKVGDC